MSRSVRLCGRELESPGHICAFFTSLEEQYETLIPYISDGVREGEDVLNVLDAARLNDHRARLTAADASLDGGVSIASSEDTYLAGGCFDIDRMVDFVGAHLERAAANGRYVRTAGWMDWLHREAPGSERAIEYEARVNLLVPRFDCTFMCVYDLSALGGAMVADIMATHPYVILKGRVRENPFYIPPEVYLRDMLSTPARSA